jgi:hypothetical protein
MNQSVKTLNLNEKTNINHAVDFLVPYVHSIIEVSSEVDVSIELFKENLINYTSL